MRTFFIPNALGHAVLRLILAVLIVAVVALVFASVMTAQDESPALPPPLVSPVEVPDVAPVVDRLYGGLDQFLQSNETQIVMGLLAFVVIGAARFILPDTKIDTEKIIALVVALFTVGYMIANAFGYDDWLSRGVQIGSIIGQTVGTILSIMGVSGLAYLTLGTGLKFPLVARSQGDQWFHMADEPELIEIEASIDRVVVNGNAVPGLDDLADQIAQGVADGIRLAG